MLRLAVVANTPPPYRVPVFQRLGRNPGIQLQVIFCSRREPNRHWDIPPLDFDHVFLPERHYAVGDRYIHNNPEVFSALRRYQPAVVVTDGFNPSHLYAFAWALFKKVPHVPMTDGTYDSELSLSAVHRAVRRYVYARSKAFISASNGGSQLYQSYGIDAADCFKSCLCINNDAFRIPAPAAGEKRYDLMFCGRIEPGKAPLFALDVAAEVARRLGRRVSILYVGSGSQQTQTEQAARAYGNLVDAHFHGFASQKDLPGLYRSARLFLFPTLADVWGVVVNEACAAGLPVIGSPFAGVNGELVRDGENAYICPLDVALWAQRAVQLLNDQERLDAFSRRSLQLVGEYTFDNAAQGLADACHAAHLHANGAASSSYRRGKERADDGHDKHGGGKQSQLQNL